MRCLDDPDRVPILFLSGEIGPASGERHITRRCSPADILAVSSLINRLFFRCYFQSNRSKINRMAHFEEMISVAGAQIRLLRGGPEEAQPLVFLHGAGGHTGWMGFLDELSRGAQGKPAVMGPWCIA